MADGGVYSLVHYVLWYVHVRMCVGYVLRLCENVSGSLFVCVYVYVWEGGGW